MIGAHCEGQGANGNSSSVQPPPPLIFHCTYVCWERSYQTIGVIMKPSISFLHALDGGVRVTRHVKLWNHFNMTRSGSTKNPLVLMHRVVPRAARVCERTRPQHCHQVVTFLGVMTPMTSDLDIHQHISFITYCYLHWLWNMVQ